MFVRTARETDVSDIARICTSRSHPTTGGSISVGDGGSVSELQFDETRLARHVQQSDEPGWVVAVDDDRIVAAAGGAVRDSSVGEVVSLHAHPEVQLTDAGSAVLQTITAQQVVAGAREQYATCFADDDEALSFYRAQGFDVVSADAAADDSADTVRLVRRI
ncbi:GNAT family N-acetyltransferase [Haloferax sp. DFSO52]|uniref:GNAT family N-acetyltransferase n=1 Tax=Haloferax sp. DFSO52 TaxID=3388505 RepID=UPI003A851EA1